MHVFATPPLSISEAHLLNIVFTAGYVLPLYLTKYTRLSFSHSAVKAGDGRLKQPSDRWRDDPAVIRARLTSATISTLAACYITHSVVSSRWKGEESVSNAFCINLWDLTSLRLGLIVHWNEPLVYLVTPLLFLGPLYGHFLGSGLPFMSKWTFKEQVVGKVFSWTGFRNYVVGPISEELVWRSCIIAAYHLAGASNLLMIFLTPISFGAAHLHHGWETYNKFGRTRQALQRAIVMTLFQFTYTTLFGFHCAYLFLRSSSVFPPMIAHTFCNFMGVPQLQEELKWYPSHRRYIQAMYMGGIVAYICTMYSWTLADNSFFWFANQSKAW
ncbi:Abi-domain-containing protein [Artomyces pyxidatus]|uniref:Abi-domain-containing protein n=1 Tax=Artomyces pyxidatus TaxID=48021 RepID=A0ACB8TBM0_9AGAM|nr:Abi-domain-containing protein [Artomyces pyxidatus]